MKTSFKVALALLCALTICSTPELSAKSKASKERAPKGQTANVQAEEVRNVIFLIGDGMGLSQVTMAMIENGYEPLVFDRAENIALIKTYSANNRVTDSAAAGTALATGFKTNNKMLGLTPALDTCYSMARSAKAKGLSTGLVVACEVQHATPAAFYAHVENRNDSKAITKQLANTDYLDIVIGGGKKHFVAEVEGTTMGAVAEKNGYKIVTNMEEFESAPEGRVLGLFADGHITPANKRGDYLQQTTTEALKRLSSNKDGFFLMVEGSQIDWACHANNANRCLLEMNDFCKTIDIAMDFADQNPGTLIVITADHETGGLSAVSGDADFTKADSGVEYKFSTKGHSGSLIPVYTYGAGAERINGIMDNTELSKKISQSLGLE